MTDCCNVKATKATCATCKRESWGNGSDCWDCHDRKNHAPSPRLMKWANDPKAQAIHDHATDHPLNAFR